MLITFKRKTLIRIAMIAKAYAEITTTPDKCLFVLRADAVISVALIKQIIHHLLYGSIDTNKGIIFLTNFAFEFLMLTQMPCQIQLPLYLKGNANQT